MSSREGTFKMTTSADVFGKPCRYCGKKTRRYFNKSLAVRLEDGRAEWDQPPRAGDIPYYSCDGCGFRYTEEEEKA